MGASWYATAAALELRPKEAVACSFERSSRLMWMVGVVIACSLMGCRSQASPTKADTAAASVARPRGADAEAAEFWRWFKNN